MKTLAITSSKLALTPQPQGLARTQIYLTREQNQTLAFVCRRTNHSKSEVIRQAIDRYLQADLVQNKPDKASQLMGLTGLWADRTDMTDPVDYVKQLRTSRF